MENENEIETKEKTGHIFLKELNELYEIYSANTKFSIIISDYEDVLEVYPEYSHKEVIECLKKDFDEDKDNEEGIPFDKIKYED